MGVWNKGFISIKKQKTDATTGKMKKCEKRAARQESDGTRVGINKKMISLAVGGLWIWKGEGKKWSMSSK